MFRGENAAGIGGSRGGNEGWSAGNIYIHGGNITVQGGMYAAGIGGGGTEIRVRERDVVDMWKLMEEM